MLHAEREDDYLRLPVDIRYRTFRNADPPHLVDVWRSQPPERALMQPLSLNLLDQQVLAKQYFDPEGVVLAFDGDLPVGFAHAAFGPTDDGRRIDASLGVTHLVMVRPHYQRKGIGRELLGRCEDYLRRRGAGVLYGGGIGHLNGFYLGLYGGSELPGVLDSSGSAQELFKQAGYGEIDRTIVLQRETASFRPPIDRRLMTLRRNATVRVEYDPPSPTWWHASTYGAFSLMRFTVDLKQPAVAEAATVTFWLMDGFSASWGVQTTGLVELNVRPEVQRQGLATFIIGEALQQLRTTGIALVEAQTMIHNTAALGLYRKLGFTVVDQAAVFRKGS
jgi:GNAT superfamily N-acetyltransferase